METSIAVLVTHTHSYRFALSKRYGTLIENLLVYFYLLIVNWPFIQQGSQYNLPDEYVKHEIHNYYEFQYLYINSWYIKHDLHYMKQLSKQ